MHDLVLQTEDVVVDIRGFIYITDKNQGLWILRYTGPQPAG
jgi:myo-inositol-hexaphosphate 3-phosphohydrolase